jgi:hypothetical protein
VKETESEIIAAQDQALRTKHHAKNIYYRQKQRENTDYVNSLKRQTVGRTHNISMPHIGTRTIHPDMIKYVSVCVCYYTGKYARKYG